MSASAAVLTSEEYEERKLFSEEVKLLTKNELEEIVNPIMTKFYQNKGEEKNDL